MGVDRCKATNDDMSSVASGATDATFSGAEIKSASHCQLEMGRRGGHSGDGAQRGHSGDWAQRGHSGDGAQQGSLRAVLVWVEPPAVPCTHIADSKG